MNDRNHNKDERMNEKDMQQRHVLARRLARQIVSAKLDMEEAEREHGGDSQAWREAGTAYQDAWREVRDRAAELPPHRDPDSVVAWELASIAIRLCYMLGSVNWADGRAEYEDDPAGRVWREFLVDAEDQDLDLYGVESDSREA